MIVKITKLNIFIFLSAICSLIQGQTADSLLYSKDLPFIVDSVRIEGNEITEDFIILRELTFSKGDTLTAEKMEYNRERVFSLGLFHKVEIKSETDGKINFCTIDVEESWYIYPIPFLNVPDGDWDRISYGAYLLWKNFRGRNETLKFVASFGYNPSFAFSYFNPVLIEKADINFQIGGLYQTVSNISEIAENIYGSEFNYLTWSGFVQFGKRINIFNEIYFEAQYNYIEAPEGIKGITASGKKIDRFPSAGISYFFDTRDLKQFPQEGVLAILEFKHRGFGADNINYNVFNIDFRNYFKIPGDLTARYRINYRLATGDLVPYYDLSLLGIGEVVRGHRNDIREGKNSLNGSIELSYPIIREWHLSLDLPLLPKSLTSARLGLRFNVFADAGHAFDPGDKLSFNSFYSGYGAGLNILILPYNVVRLEYAFNEFGIGEWLIGTGFSF